MRKVRRKTIEPSARSYLLQAQKEGLELSWNHWETMLPQDGFGLLGLTCQECLQGPCRLNPFRPEETATICGFTKDDLVFNGLLRRVSQTSQLAETAQLLLENCLQHISSGKADGKILQDKADFWQVEGGAQSLAGWMSKAWELTAPLAELGQKNGEDRLEILLNTAAHSLTLLKFNSDLLEILQGIPGLGKRRIGLGNLAGNSVNICLDGVSPVLWSMAAEVAGEMELEAVSAGLSDGYNLLLVGDFSLYQDFNIVCNQGAVEFALLSGLVDLFLVGCGSISRGRNLAGSLQTVWAECPARLSKEELRELFRQAAKTARQRKNKGLGTDYDGQIVNIGYILTSDLLQAAANEGSVNGLCIIAGGSNIKVTADEMAVKLLKTLAAQNILCLSYGNAAVTLGHYGCLASTELKGGSLELSDIISLDSAANPVAYCLGGETAAAMAVELVKDSALKVLAVFPEMTSNADLQAALAFAQTGAKVLTGVKVPADGSELICCELGQILEYYAPEEIAEKALQYFADGS
ncbi:MAG TPA: hypothetical protein VN374_08125 [Desulfitobacteriaceae bacterium]|nr:hypothetical protein [Desulfitobacteriaceae bacterium]